MSKKLEKGFERVKRSIPFISIRSQMNITNETPKKRLQSLENSPSFMWQKNLNLREKNKELYL